MYDIRNVGVEYMLAEQYSKNGDIENAVMHYQATISNYKYADNEYLISPSSPYSVTECGETITYPSINEMIQKSYIALKKLRK